MPVQLTSSPVKLNPLSLEDPLPPSQESTFIPAEAFEQATNPLSPLLKVFGTTFLTVFLAELGDKTQLTTLLMSAESNAPWVVFLGAGAALVTTSFLGVWVGQWIASRVSPKTLETGAGMMLLVIAALLLWDVVGG
ncbi:MAG: TMEM165/GDT1 family protein [Leptolyngbyaceae cyanobacterium bins.59]|nr:TMEM165/GDT1 family protein [Leptolyngbyaceae cyanobacterium bins.59]